MPDGLAHLLRPDCAICWTTGTWAPSRTGTPPMSRNTVWSWSKSLRSYRRARSPFGLAPRRARRWKSGQAAAPPAVRTSRCFRRSAVERARSNGGRVTSLFVVLPCSPPGSPPIDSPVRPRYAEIKWLVTAPSSGCAIRSLLLTDTAPCARKTRARLCLKAAVNHISRSRIQE